MGWCWQHAVVSWGNWCSEHIRRLKTWGCKASFFPPTPHGFYLYCWVMSFSSPGLYPGCSSLPEDDLSIIVTQDILAIYTSVFILPGSTQAPPLLQGFFIKHYWVVRKPWALRLARSEVGKLLNLSDRLITIKFWIIVRCKDWRYKIWCVL